jgi:hypothetical protein
MSAQATLTMLGNVVQIAGYPGQFLKKWRSYTLALTRTAVVSAIFSGSIQIDPNAAPFLCVGLHADDTADGTFPALEDWLVNAQDNQNGYTWCDGYVSRLSLFGAREFGLNFPDEFALKSNTRISFNVQNKAAAPTAGVATLVLRGWQLIAI